MLRSLLSVGGFTLLSRVAGLLRDMVTSRVLGHGLLSDAFFVAFRLPNHFRTIFAEGAYNAAFVPMYTALRTKDEASAHHFSRVMLGWQIAVQLVLLAVALMATPYFVAVLAPGYIDKPEQMALAVDLTRITFAYLICIAIVTHLGGMLNAEKKFWAAAAAPIVLNIAIAASLLIAYLFPSAAHAASWGVVAGGVAEVLLLAGAAYFAKLPVAPAMPKADANAKQFLWRFGPATVGAAGVQLGTRFVCATESIAHPAFKKAFLRASARDAVASVQVDPRLPVIPVRALKNAGTEAFTAKQREVAQMLDEGRVDMEAAQLEIEHYWAGALRRAVIDGDVENGSLMAGQSVGMVTSEQSAAEIIAELADQAERSLTSH